WKVSPTARAAADCSKGNTPRALGASAMNSNVDNRKDSVMKALTWCAPYKVAIENVPDPKILNPRDAIVRVTSTCICGSDLHLLDGFIPFMKPGDIMGHEPMGIVEELGSGVDKSRVSVGDRVVVPFPIACGSCFFCKRELYSCCENS